MKKILLLILILLCLLMCSCQAFSEDHIVKKAYSFYPEQDYYYDCDYVKYMILEEFTRSNGYNYDVVVNEDFFKTYYSFNEGHSGRMIVKISSDEVEDFFHIRLFYVVEWQSNRTYENMLFMVYRNKVYRMSYRPVSRDEYALGAYCFTIYGSATDFQLDYFEQVSSLNFGVLKYSFNSRSKKLTMSRWNGYCTCPEDDTYSYGEDDLYFRIAQITETSSTIIPIPPYVKRRPLYTLEYTEEGILKYYLINDDIHQEDYYYDDSYIPTKCTDTMKFKKEIIPDMSENEEIDVFVDFKRN